MVRLHGLVALSVALSLSAGCKPRVGGRCTAGRAYCIDDESALFCGPDGTYEAITCGGAKRCRRYSTLVTCDQSVAALGSACTRPGFACATDMKSALSCQGGLFVLVETCAGPEACRVLGDIRCDNDVASPGDPCRADGDYACTPDHMISLRCTNREMIAINSCRGPKQCSIVHSKPWEADFECDMSIAAENDPCFFAGYEACTADKKTMLTCKGSWYSSPIACLGEKGCSVTMDGKAFRAHCDTGGD
jgi:hypothetical protein